MLLAESFELPPFTRLRKHDHDFPHICVVLDGGFIEREKKAWRDVAAGTVRVSGAARHDIDFGATGGTCLVIEGNIDGVTLADPRFIESDHRLFRLAADIREAETRHDPAGRVSMDDLTTEFLAQIDRNLRGRTAAPPPWLEKVREIIHDSSGATSVADIASQAGVHRVHVARTFRDHYGMPVTSYARRVRLRAALTLLAGSSHSLSRVALDSGYADQAHFTREARAVTGATPGQLRAQLSATGLLPSVALPHHAKGSR